MLDQWPAVALVALAVWIAISGLDDLFISTVFLFLRKPFPWPADAELAREPERPTALLVPLWQESEVIRHMLERNLAAVRYRNYQLFVGVYPNDESTCRVVSDMEVSHRRIHLAPVSHDGPTSKADCLNAVYRRMLAYEAQSGVRFEAIVIHDAEDLIHPESLRLINWYLGAYQMVQVPVLPLPSRAIQFTRGIYCDEFAEFQTKDIPVRQHLGGFLASNGVGTGFARDALEQIAATQGGCIFDPACLTEDYETGYRLFLQGCRQIFLPLCFHRGQPVATQEYFPRRLRAAVRQRSRWVTGIALQGWQHHGWGGRQAYWFWRDRKGLAGNLLSPLVNALWVAGAVDPNWRSVAPDWAFPLYLATSGVAIVQIFVRVAASAHVYGWCFASLAILRMPWGNLVNFLATAAALGQFALATLRREAVAWRKTDHDYPLPGLPLQQWRGRMR